MIGRWVLPAFAFAVSTAYWPFWHDGAISPKWMVLAAMPLTLFWIKPRMTVGHWAGLALLTYSAVSGLWSVAPFETANSVFRWALLGAAFLVAAETSDMRRTYAAAAIGVSLSGFIALSEVVGALAIPEANHPAALYGNRNYLAEMAALSIVAAVGYRLWWTLPGLVLALALPMSKAAFLGVGAAAFVAVWRYSRVMAACALFAFCIAGFVASQIIGGFDGIHSLAIRFDIWSTALSNLTIFGNGSGSFQSMYVLLYQYTSIPLGRPENAHNEFINLAFEVGVPGIMAAAILCLAAWCGGLQTERCIMAALGAISIFGFPLHVPATGFMAAIVAGHLCGHGHRVRSDIRGRRGGVHARDGGIGPRYSALGV